MTNPTSNYNFQMPTSTDLVTDLPADFEVFGQAVDTRLKALQPGTTLGDLAYSSATANTNTRLGIGTTNQVLSVVGGVPAWAAASAGPTNYTLLNAGGTALTGAGTITISGIAAKELLILVAGASSASAGSLIYMRINGDATNNYSNFGIDNSVNTSYAATTLSSTSGTYSGQSLIYIGTMASNAAATVTGSVFIDLADQTGWKRYQTVGSGNAAGGGGNDWGQYITQGFYEASAAITSISLISQTGNFDAGTIYVLGAN